MLGERVAVGKPFSFVFLSKPHGVERRGGASDAGLGEMVLHFREHMITS